MKKLFTALIAAFLFITSACYAQLGEAPMPMVKPGSSGVSGPSLEETSKWISEKLKRENTIPNEKPKKEKLTYFYSEASFDECNMTFITREETYLEGKFAYKNVSSLYLIPLSEVDANTIEGGPFTSYLPIQGRVTFRSIGARPVFHVASGAVISNGFASEAQMLNHLKTIGATIRGDQIVYGRDFVGFQTLDLELAERVATALKHAVKLCQAKAIQEKEKAAQEKAEKAKLEPKEIF